ncbi:hypothetical protein KBD59_04530 [Candidatus Gracilibacteria bacterium]|nr:hypothetical protein [Candidatus Gracilibacteria bacterium]
MRKSFEAFALTASLAACGSAPASLHKDLGKVSTKTSAAVQQTAHVPELTSAELTTQALRKLGEAAQNGNTKAAKMIRTAIQNFCLSKQKEEGEKLVTAIDRCLKDSRPAYCAPLTDLASASEEDLDKWADDSQRTCEEETLQTYFK